MQSCTDSSFRFDTWKSGIQLRINNIGSGGSDGSGGSSALNNIKREIQSVLDCIKSEISRVRSSTNTIFNEQYSISDLQEQIIEEEANIYIAKQRLESIRNPERYTSYYESWFPIDRPIKPITTITLIALITFLSVFLLLCILSLLGINLTFQIDITSSMGLDRYTFMYWLKSQFTLSSAILLCILVGVIIYFIKRS
jgi:hypothetical protein